MGVGGCLRDVSGCWIKGFSQYIGEGTALKAELWAIMLGLQIASHIEIETDCSTAMDIILHASTNHHPMGTIINNCRFLLFKLENYRLSKGSRK